MELTFSIASVFLLVSTFWQDLKTRTIQAWLLPAIGLAMLLGSSGGLRADEIIYNAGINLALLAAQFLILWFWISVKNKAFVNIIDTQIGLGDVLFFICLTPAFSPLNFCFFFTAGIVLSLITHAVHRLLFTQSDPRIPLAGYLSMQLALLVILQLTTHTTLRFSDDAWLSDSLLSLMTTR